MSTKPSTVQADEFTAHDLAPTNTEELAHFTASAAKTAALLNHYDAHPTAVGIASYGEHGKERSHAVLAGLIPHLDNQAEPPLIVQIHIDPDNNTVETYQPLDGQWSEPEPIKGDAIKAYAALHGYAPAASLEAAKNAYEHTGQTAWQPLPAEQTEALARKSQLSQAADALVILNRLAQPGSTPQEADYPQLAALLQNSALTRDFIAIHASKDRSHAEVLRQAFLSSPAEHTSILAATAAVAHYAAGDQIGGKQLALQVPPNRPETSLSDIILKAENTGYAPYKLKAVLTQVAKELPQAMRHVDAQNDRKASREANFPTTGRNTTTDTTQQPKPKPKNQPGKENDTGHEK